MDCVIIIITYEEYTLYIGNLRSPHTAAVGENSNVYAMSVYWVQLRFNTTAAVSGDFY